MKKHSFETERDGFYDTYYEKIRARQTAPLSASLATTRTTTWQSVAQSGCIRTASTRFTFLPGSTTTATSTNLPKTGDNSNLASCFALLLVGGGALTATAVIGSNKKRSER